MTETTILLIEDNPEVRENTAEILELSGYKVLTAPNGKIGVKLAQEAKPNLIICDIMMPELDGYGVLMMLNKNPQTAGIPFIFLTARVEKADIRKGMNMGADDYLTKPYDETDLLAAVESRLKKSAIVETEIPRNGAAWSKFMSETKHLDILPELKENAETKRFRAKDTVYAEGSFPAYLYFVKRGKLKTFRTNDDAKEYITGIYKEGDFFGYTDLLRNEPYTESTSVLEEAEILLIAKETFLTLIYDNRDVSYAFMRMLAENVAEKHDRLMHLAYDTIRKRVADALLHLHERYSHDSSMSISRENLANIVGTSKECVIRVLSEFKDDQILETQQSIIILKDTKRLEKIRY